MGRIKGVNYYNDMYSGSKIYNLSYRDSPYYVLWTQIIQFLKKVENPRILEIGCGSGQFASYLYDEGYRRYHGFDFSNKAIDIAKRTVKQSFAIGNAEDPSSYNYDYNVVVALEVMEHVKEDLAIIKRIKKGTYFLFSLPTFDDPAHVRWFTTHQAIANRYYTLLDLKRIVRIENWFGCYGIVQDFNPGFTQRIIKTRERVTLRYIARRLYRRIRP